MPLTVTEPIPNGVRVRVCGEVDVSCADELRDALSQALADTTNHVEVDLSEVTYIDSTGIGALVGAAHRAADSGVAFRVAHPQRNVLRVLNMLGLGKDLGLQDGSATDE